MYRSKGTPTPVPTGGVPRLRGPDPPSGLLPFSGDTAVDTDVACSRCHAARPSSTSIGRCCAGASGEVFSDAMRSAGLVSRSIPGERLLYRVFNTIGETLPSMALARQAVALVQGALAGRGPGRRRVGRRAVGVDGAAVRRVGVRPPSSGGATAGARNHHAVRPRQAVRRPDRARRRRGHPLGRERRRHVRRHARRSVRVVVGQARRRPRVGRRSNDVDLDESYAYSDSVYDIPLLSAVAYPIVVNPDPRMAVIARARRWPVLNLDVSPGVMKVPLIGLELQRLAMQFTRPSLVPYARFEFEGVENVPVAGAGDPRRQPPLVLRLVGDLDADRQDRSHRALPRQEGGVRRARRRPAGGGDGRYPGRSGHRIRRTAQGGGRRARSAARW